MGCDLGEVICQYRQGKKMTQEEFASRIGVTPQAVSKWERGNGLPDVALIGGICSVLGISADTLFGLEGRVVENGNPNEDTEVKNNLVSEPIVLEFSASLIELICEGLNTSLVQDSRKRLAREEGLLLPIIRFRDNIGLQENEYRVLSYGKEIISGKAEPDGRSFFANVIASIEEHCTKNYADVINKSIVKTLVDNIKTRYPGIVDGVVPEQISYLKVEKRLKQILSEGKSIKDLIHILEDIEDQLLE